MSYMRQVQKYELHFDDLTVEQSDALVEYYSTGCPPPGASIYVRVDNAHRGRLFAMWERLHAHHAAIGIYHHKRADFTEGVLGHEQSWSDMSEAQAARLDDALKGACLALGIATE